MGKFWSNTLYFVGCASILSFIINLTWEYVQCSPLFIHLKLGATSTSMILATLGDVAIMWTSYLGVVVFSRSLLWARTSTGILNWILFALISAIIAEVIEYSAINRQLWAYSSITPTINGVSLIPALQMIIINPFTIFATQKIAAVRESKLE